MSSFTLDSLRSILQQDVGMEDSTVLEGDILDMPFEDMGYDSLAMLQVAIAIQNQHGIELPDDAPTHMRTPREAIAYVNGMLTST